MPAMQDPAKRERPTAGYFHGVSKLLYRLRQRSTDRGRFFVLVGARYCLTSAHLIYPKKVCKFIRSLQWRHEYDENYSSTERYDQKETFRRRQKLSNSTDHIPFVLCFGNALPYAP